MIGSDLVIRRRLLVLSALVLGTGCSPSLERGPQHGGDIPLGRRWLVECLDVETGDLLVALATQSRERRDECLPEEFDADDIERLEGCDIISKSLQSDCRTSIGSLAAGFGDGVMTWFRSWDLDMDGEYVAGGWSGYYTHYHCDSNGYFDLSMWYADVTFERTRDDEAEVMFEGETQGEFAALYCPL